MEVEEQLNIKESGSGNVKKGVAMGLEGDLFLYLVASAVTGLVIMMLTINSLGAADAVLLGVLPSVVMFVYLWLFKIGKPPGYQHDVIDRTINGDGFEPVTIKKTKTNPFMPKEKKK